MLDLPSGLMQVGGSSTLVKKKKKIASKIHMLRAKPILGITKKIMIPTRLGSYVASVTMVYLGTGLNSTSRVLEMTVMAEN